MFCLSFDKQLIPWLVLNQIFLSSSSVMAQIKVLVSPSLRWKILYFQGDWLDICTRPSPVAAHIVP